MIKNKNIFLLYLVGIVFAMALSFGVTCADVFANADECVTVESVTATRLTGFDNEGRPIFTSGVDYDTYFRGTANPYAKDITVTFRAAAEASYYKIVCLKDGEEEPEGIRLETVPANGLVSLDVTGSGEYTVTCSVYSDLQVLLGTKSVTVKSDEIAPTLPTSNSMTEWLANGNNFDVVLDWSEAGDTLSGVNHAFYRVYYTDGTLSSVKEIEGALPDRSYLVINKAGRLNVTVFDAAGNSAEKDFVFDMYDTVKPMSPSFTVSPTVTAGKYARSYTITLTYYADGQSGLADRQHYLMNGRSYEYEEGVGIILDEQKNYSFSFYAMDKTGNRSEYVNYEINNSVFDVKAPYIDSATFSTEVDLTKSDGVCKVSFVATDYQESGIVSFVMENSDKSFNVLQKNGNYDCSLYFDCFDGAYLQKIILTDAVGNKAEHSFVVDYFGDEKVNAYCKELYALYRDTDYTKCSQAAKNAIDEAFSAMNILLNTAGNTVADIKAQYETIKNLYQPVAFSKVNILEAPEYASAALSFVADQSDFETDSFGNTLEVIIVAEKGDGNAFVSESGFSTGFTDYFALNIKLNGQNLSAPLQNGLTVTTGLPSGYLDRNVKLYNSETGAEIETVVIDNRIRFTLKESASFALVISGGRTPTMYGDSGKKTIEVFGRTWPLGTFLGVVLGVGGGAIVIVVLVLVLGKKRG